MADSSSGDTNDRPGYRIFLVHLAIQQIHKLMEVSGGREAGG